MRLALVIIFLVSVGIWFLVEGINKPTSLQTNEKQSQITPGPTTVLAGQDQGEGSVTMAVEYLEEQTDGQKMTLRVVLDTHSVDLGDVDFRRDIFVEKDGRTYYPVSSSDEGSGHHRASLLVFEPLKPPFKVVGQNIGGVSRREVELKE